MTFGDGRQRLAWLHRVVTPNISVLDLQVDDEITLPPINLLHGVEKQIAIDLIIGGSVDDRLPAFVRNCEVFYVQLGCCIEEHVRSIDRLAAKLSNASYTRLHVVLVLQNRRRGNPRETSA